MDSIEVSYTPSIDDLVAFNAYVAAGTPTIRQRVLLTRVLGGVIVLMGLLLLLMWLVLRELFPLLLGLVAVGLGLMYAIGSREMMLRATAKMARRLYSQTPGGLLLLPRTLTISPEGIAERSQYSTGAVSWHAVTWVSEMESAGLLWVSPVNAYIVPKRAFADDVAFREFLTLAEKYRASASPPQAA